MIILIAILIVLIQNSMIIFPFKTTLYFKNKEIDQNNIKYDTDSFINDNYFQPLYTTIKIGNPPQNIKFLLSYNDCGFKIGKCNKCINNYLSHYNKNSSLDFKFTNYFNKSNYEFKNGSSAEESIYAYTDLDLKNLKKFENIGFYLGTDTNEEVCGIIGFKTDNYKLYCSEMNNIFNSFKIREITNSGNWIIKYTSYNEGLLIFDPELNKIIDNYNENKLFITNSEKTGSGHAWSVIIDKIFSENKNESINKNQLKAEFDNDLGMIEGSGDYYYYITTTYFKEYIKKKICYLNEVHANVYYYFAIECDKEKFGLEDMKKFPTLSLVLISFQKEFSLNYKDLFTETKYKYFFNIIFNIYITERWILGKPFLRKYPILFNFNLQTIGYYNEEFKAENEPSDEINYKFISNKNLIFLILIIIILIVVSSITFYLIGKHLNKIRKKKANELDDEDFDYNPSYENKNDLFNEDKNKTNTNEIN